MKTTQQALEAARNETAIIQEWNSKQFVWHGCYEDSTNQVLSDLFVSDAEMMPEKCWKICQSYSFSGVENGKECFCGNTKNGNPTRYPWEQCSKQRGGKSQRYCEGIMKIRMWSK